MDVALDFVRLAPAADSHGRLAGIPYEYIDEEHLRISIYRKIAESGSCSEISALETELTDRFGPVPPPAKRLLKIAESS